MKRPAFLTLNPSSAKPDMFRKSLRVYKDLFKAVARIPKVPVTGLDQALCAWGLDDFSPEQVEAFRRKRLMTGMLGGSLFCFLAFLFFINYWHSSLGILSCIEYFFALFSVMTVSMICLWQSDVLSDGAFVPFIEYVRKGKWLFSVVVLLGLAFLDHSAQSIATELLPVDMPDLTVQKSDDLSAIFIGSVIGSPWLEFAPNLNIRSVHLSSVLIPILDCLNGIALFFITVFAIYIFTFGTTQIAHTGKWADSQIFSTFWSPLRTCAAIAMCTPLGNGVSVLHHLILVAVAVSINLANNVTTTCVDYLTTESNMMRMAPPVVSFQKDQYPELFTTAAMVLTTRMLIINVIGNRIYDDVYFAEQVVTPDNLSESPPYRVSATKERIKVSFPSPRDFSFPTIIIRSEMNENDRGFVHRRYSEAIEAMLKNMNDFISKSIPQKLEERGLLSVADIQAAIRNVHDSYMKETKDVVDWIRKVSDSEGMTTANTIREQLKGANSSFGWIMFGIYPFAIAQAQSMIQKDGEFTIEITGMPTSEEVDKYVTSTAQYDEGRVAAADLLSKMRQSMANLGNEENENYGFEEQNITASSLGRKIMSYAGLDLKELIEEFKTRNPIAVMYSKGWNIVKYACWGVTLIGAGNGILDSVLKKIEPSTAGRNLDAYFQNHKILKGLAGVASGGAGIVTAWMPFLLGLIMMLIMFGVSCCYVLPALPMLYWARALVSWAVLIVETLMGAPFWAAAHIFPEGIGLAGQHARRGYIMLMDVFMRPTLLCCGVIMSMLLMEVVIKILAHILDLWVNITSVATTSDLVMGTIGYIVSSILAIYIIYTSIKFLYIEILGNFPYQVLVWCGGHDIPRSTMDYSRMEQDVAGKLTSAADSMASRVGHGTEDMAKKTRSLDK